MFYKTLKIYTVFIIFFLLITELFAGEYTLNNVPREFIGTYIPTQYDTLLRATKNHVKAVKAAYKEYHDILFLDKNICYSDAGFHDGYAIPAAKFKDFRFVENTAGKFILDDKGNSYRKLSDKPKGYDDFEAYILSVTFEDALTLKNVSLKANKITINHVEFSVLLDINFFEREGVSLWLKGKNGFYALVKNGISAKIYESYSKSPEILVSNKYLLSFPVFDWNDKDYPDIEYQHLSKTDLRYLRNLIYAKHGYRFKSKDLQNIYENFSWYKPNESFSEDDFSRQEKSLLRSILYYEKNQIKRYE